MWKERKKHAEIWKGKNKVKSNCASISLPSLFLFFWSHNNQIDDRKREEKGEGERALKRPIWPSSAELLFLLRLFSRLLVFAVRSPWTRRPTLPRSSTPSTERFFSFCLNLIICHLSAQYFQNEKIFTNLHLVRTNFFGSLTVVLGIGFRSWSISLPFVSQFWLLREIERSERIVELWNFVNDWSSDWLWLDLHIWIWISANEM